MIPYFDLHCDTATALYDKGETLSTSTCHISESSISEFEKYGQVFAIFSKNGLGDDECYERFFEVRDKFFSDNGKYFINGKTPSESNRKYVLSVEDGRLLSSDLKKLDVLYGCGVRILTPLWSGVTCIGGSFDTDEGLSDFGKKVINRCFDLGIIPDISHASVKSASEIADAADKRNRPFIASHSNSFSVWNHPRNINDTLAKRVAASGGIIGICLCAFHIGENRVSSYDAVSHMKYLYELIGEDHICLGCDFDGTDDLPSDINNQKELSHLADTMKSCGFSERSIDKIFYGNAARFIKDNIV